MEKRLYRSPAERRIAGICGGLAEYFNVDPVLVRVIFVVLFFLSGIGLLVYIIFWLVLPVREKEAGTVEIITPSGQEEMVSEPSKTEESTGTRKKHNFFGGIILIGLGVIFLAENFLPVYRLNKFWPLLLIIFGLAILWKSGKR
ncbi:MAG: PspC domain-containing protein [Candidatus Omnitrophica bacterium]|nr:PspC domain-containing protein [Candidatus Omnitrophota bacterium]